MNRTRPAGAAMLAALLLSLPACDREPAPEPGNPVAGPEAEPLDPALLAALPDGYSADQAELGHSLYAVCSVCHGLDGHGTQLGPSLRDGEWEHVPPEIDPIAALIRSGIPQPGSFEIPMPAGGGGAFDDEELRALALYVYLISQREGDS